ncbi:uncharacterized protein BDV14DRAFT_175248 [Aspergillus stella-maris]|uniref:uncharacterized protein n=1 Tax=Aspergillus stella-maris TaxID=1810926 RepID=UPI003CCDE72A
MLTGRKTGALLYHKQKIRSIKSLKWTQTKTRLKSPRHAPSGPHPPLGEAFRDMMSAEQKFRTRIGTPRAVSEFHSQFSACREALGSGPQLHRQHQCRASNISLSRLTHCVEKYINLDGSCFGLLSFFFLHLLFVVVYDGIPCVRDRQEKTLSAHRIHIPLSLRATADLPLFGRIHM